MAVAVVFLLFLVGTQAQLAWDQVPLNQFPFIMVRPSLRGGWGGGGKILYC